MDDNSTYEYESRGYINPTISRDEQTQFIDNLRQSQESEAARIGAETRALGTDIDQSMGGLAGSEGVWRNRYELPQTNSMVENLRSAAQQTALNQAYNNLQNQWQQRYKVAYRAAYKRAKDKEKSNSNNNNNNNTGDVEKEIVGKTNFKGVADSTVRQDENGNYIFTDPNTGETTKVLKSYMEKLYNKDGSLTDEGAVILDTRQLLGL